MTSTPTRSPQPTASPTATNESQAIPHAPIQDVPSIITRKASSVQLIANSRQTRQTTASDTLQQNDAPPTVLPKGLSSSEVIKAVRKARASSQSENAPISTNPEAVNQSSNPSPPSRSSPTTVAGRKRKAAELDSARSDTVNASEQVEGPTPSASEPEIQATPDVALPSVETGSTTNTTAKSRRPAPKPHAPPRTTKGAQSATHIGVPLTVASKRRQTPQIQNDPTSTPRALSTAQTEADALLQNVTSQFSAVSRLADGIDGTSRAAIAARSGTTPQASTQTAATLANALNRAAARQAQARTTQDLAAEIIGEAVGVDISDKPKPKRRRKSPDDAEEHVIDPTEVKMGDLTRDTGLGKKSGIEVALENIDWKAVKQQQKEMAEEARKKQEAERAEKRSGKTKKRKPQKEPGEEALVPGMRVVNGVIELDPESREIDIRRDAETEAAREDANALTIDKLTTRRNQGTIGKPKGLQGRGLQWSDEMDDRFYRGVRMFGADMLMITSLFPGLERAHVKKKFVREERANPERLREALFNPTSVDEEAYQQETGMELGDPQKLDEELKAMEADLRKRFEEQMAEQQGGAHPVEIDDADIPIQSREQGSVEPETGVNRTHTSRGRENRFNAMADDIVSEALGLRPTAAKKAKKKAATAGRKKKDGSAAAPRKGTKAARQAAALQLTGTVEEIGTVDEVPR